MHALHLKRVTWIAFLAGLAAFVLLVGYHGLGEVAAALAVAGWGLPLIAAAHIVPMGAEALGWRYLIDPAHRPGFRTMLWGRWIGEAVDNLLPVAQVGGDLVRIRLFRTLGMPAAVVAASLVADITLTVVTLIGFTLFGLVLLAAYVTGDGPLLLLALVIPVSALLIGGFYLVQQRGLFGGVTRLLQRVVGPLDARLVDGAEALDRENRRIYARRKDVLRSAFWLSAAWVLGTFEVWLALWLLGYPVSLLEALLIESLVQAVRTAAFLIPGALGVQEGGFLALGMLLSLPPEAALALALTRRVRELAFGIPGILAWQWCEARRLWRWGRGSRAPAADAARTVPEKAAKLVEGRSTP